MFSVVAVKVENDRVKTSMKEGTERFCPQKIFQARSMLMLMVTVIINKKKKKKKSAKRTTHPEWSARSSCNS